MAFNVGVRLQNWVFLVCLFGYRFVIGTTRGESESELKCNSYGMPHSLRGLLSFGEGYSSNCKKDATRLSFLFIYFWISSQWNHFSNSIYNLCFVVFGIMQETMSKEHAMRFPLVGSAMLLSLFLLFKFLSKDLVNAVLTAYFFVLGIVALSYVQSILCFWFIFLVCVYLCWILIFLFLIYTILCFVERHCYLLSEDFCRILGMTTLSSGVFLISDVCT